MSGLPPQLPEAELAALDATILRALDTGDESGLDVLGYGEISCVVRHGDHACKRLPLFDDVARFSAYRALFEEYITTLSSRGVKVTPSALGTVPQAHGKLGAYCIQPLIPADALLTRRLAVATEDEARALVREVFARILSVTGPRVGIDGQLSNWVHTGGELLYLDVTTPLLRDETGRELIDADLFLASLPWVLRGAVRTFMLHGIIDTYYDPRTVIRDVLANLLKERLERYLPALLDEANRVVPEKITETEVRRYYAGDARTWALLQRLRRLDRAFQRRVLGRVYPFLLPRKIER